MKLNIVLPGEAAWGSAMRPASMASLAPKEDLTESAGSSRAFSMATMVCSPASTVSRLGKPAWISRTRSASSPLMTLTMRSTVLMLTPNSRASSALDLVPLRARAAMLSATPGGTAAPLTCTAFLRPGFTGSASWTARAP